MGNMLVILYKSIFFLSFFLAACTQLYKPLCQSICPSFGHTLLFFAKGLIVSHARDLWRSALFSFFLLLATFFFKRKMLKSIELHDIECSIKKVLHKSEEKMHKKMMTLQKAKNLVHVKQHFVVSFLQKKIFLKY